MAVKNYNLSIVFEAPLIFVYQWCTDYREDDNKITGSNTVRHFIERTAKKVVWINHGVKDGKDVENVRIVNLRPPNRWNVEGMGERYNIEGKYSLKSAGRNRTRLLMSFRIHYKAGPAEEKKTWGKELNLEWSKYKAALERDYHISKSIK